MSETRKQIVLLGAEQQLFFSRLITKALMALIVVFMIGIVCLVMGLGGGITLVAGSALSGITLWRFTMRVHWEARTGRVERSWGAAVTGFAAFIPYVFGCYLVFYSGFWGLTDLFGGFSWFILTRTALFVLFGFAIVNGTYKVSEVATAVTEGRLRIS